VLARPRGRRLVDQPQDAAGPVELATDAGVQDRLQPQRLVVPAHSPLEILGRQARDERRIRKLHVDASFSR
jgi:hypothetical protein